MYANRRLYREVWGGGPFRIRAFVNGLRIVCKEVTVRSGRFGPYVTDGEVNASLRKGDTPEKINIERAADILAARRERIANS